VQCAMTNSDVIGALSNDQPGHGQKILNVMRTVHIWQWPWAML